MAADDRPVAILDAPPGSSPPSPQNRQRDYFVITMADLRVKTRLIRIGNSRGVRLAKPLLEQAGLEDEVEIRVEPGAVVITAVAAPRAGWAEAAARLGPSRLVDAPSPTRFDETEWTW